MSAEYENSYASLNCLMLHARNYEKIVKIYPYYNIYSNNKCYEIRPNKGHVTV